MPKYKNSVKKDDTANKTIEGDLSFLKNKKNGTNKVPFFYNTINDQQDERRTCRAVHRSLLLFRSLQHCLWR